MSDTRRKESEKKIRRVTKGEHSENKFNFNEYQNRIDEEDDWDDFQDELDDLLSDNL